MKRRAFLAGIGVTVVAASCSSNSTPTASSKNIPDAISAILRKPRYAQAKWSLLVADVSTGETLYELDADRMALTGSTRKLFSVGTALNALGADHRVTTPVHRLGTVDAGVLNGNLVLVGNGDLTFGGRRIDANTVQYTDFDHNDANALGTAILTPQDPLYGVTELAKQVKASGINAVNGDVVIDDRLFTPYRVPNGNLLITPILLNENMVDVTVDPTQPGQPARLDYRPRTAALAVTGAITTGPADSTSSVALSDQGRIECVGSPGCGGSVSGDIPAGYKAPLTGSETFVGTFRIDDPASFARTAFIEALAAQGVTVTAPAVAKNPPPPATTSYSDDTRVASFESAPLRQDARLILKVSLNLGANLALSLFGLSKGRNTIQGALAAERQSLIDQYGVDGNQFSFPTNGSGTPDSQAAPRALVRLLTAMAKTPVAADFQSALPIMGVDGSLAHTGQTLAGKGHVFAKPGTTIMPGADGETLELEAQNLAGYIETKSGRTVAYAVMVNDAGPVLNIADDVGAVFEDEGEISSIIYETL
ncbi:D-alanyl-D-alanine carboxypeptidase/D-alanyl-D-alanine endopeptidase [Antrihabitans cavernicola]|uniref:D-alanyl-D-alanine carboxypeptidase/D-alanyl-D-alanine-endopeptidase n=1 Tax=Antrihabitans cavernicola TaxID=2495913 RepID=A0A5A7SF45_9NOCA|nr:D-alanyl-D-alanine carboxypeptidase/D-alanyl-D-alanine-endopeptidase [Spelaeibacter cavernicola]KAA0024059.1 D-alanyl-D-alanine carboxypeptidase/D-alanyl-D-alanine-endopeptidase [Spelaeibacter cavernicola]